MADISIIKVNNVDYNIKDAQASADIAALIGSGDASGAVSVADSNLKTCIMSAVYAYIHPFGALGIDSILGTSNNS